MVFVQFLFGLEAEATPDPSACGLHDAGLKQGFIVGPETHGKPPTTVLEESNSSQADLHSGEQL